MAGDGDGTNRADAAQQAHVQDQAGACRTSWPPCLWPSLPSIPFAVLVLSVPVQMIGPGRSLPVGWGRSFVCLCSRRRHIPVPLFSEAPAAGTLFVLSDRGCGKPLEMQRVARAPSEIDRGGKRGRFGPLWLGPERQAHCPSRGRVIADCKRAVSARRRVVHCAHAAAYDSLAARVHTLRVDRNKKKHSALASARCRLGFGRAHIAKTRIPEAGLTLVSA